tara:strand:- start:265 stop:462 length:198 start_codon:yes stop_codon:yes gene_type:complete
MFNGKRKKYLKKLMEYAESWDTERHGYVVVERDGRLIQTNNIDLGKLTMTKGDLFNLIAVIDSNT